jgi:hypothetical protein
MFGKMWVTYTHTTLTTDLDGAIESFRYEVHRSGTRCSAGISTRLSFTSSTSRHRSTGSRN